MSEFQSIRMYDSLFSTPEMSKAMADRAFFGWMLRVEQALARAEEACGVIPKGTASTLGRVQLSSLDLARISTEAGVAGNICIPFVKALTAATAAMDAQSGNYVHWGATSQDIIDTALVLQMRAAFGLVKRDLHALYSALADRIDSMTDVPMPGRTWLQHGPPVTLRFKMATWLDALQRHRERISEAETRIFALQFGGAVGTLAALGHQGRNVLRVMAHELELDVPGIPWHTQRDRFAELAVLFGMIGGTLGKIGRDVSLLMQPEVGEFAEPAAEGKGGSSTMPHKTNPVGCAVLLSAATRIPGLVSTILSGMVQEHERGLGGWHSEWETLTEIGRLTGGSLARAVEIARDGSWSEAAMCRNLQALSGLPMSEAASFLLAKKIGKTRAHHLLELASRSALASGNSLIEELKGQTEIVQHVTIEELEYVLAPEHYLGMAASFVEEVLRREEGHR